MPPVAWNHHTPSTTHNTTRTRVSRAIISFKSACQFPTGISPCFAPRYQTSPLLPQTPPAHGKNIPTPPCTSASLQLATALERCTTRTVLGTPRCGAEQQTLTARPHLAGDVLREHAELIRPLSSRQTTERQGQRGGVARRAIREFGTGPGCAFWLMRGGP